MRHLLAAGLLGLAALSARAQGRSQTHLDYFATYAPLAVAEMQAHGIPASITLAQGLLESGAGQSDLATRSNNHFGIKCPGGWDGDTHHAKDDDYRNGRLVKSCFRAYGSAAESYADHSAFLVNSPRYARLFTLEPHDYRGWARGLKQAGYATSRTYAARLIELIERYELQQYDRHDGGLPVAPQLLAAADEPTGPTMSSVPARPALSGAAVAAATQPARARERPARPSDLIKTVNDVDYAEALPGESLAALAARTGRNVRELTRYNETLRPGAALRPGQRVFLQPKRSSYRGREKHHRVGATETLQSIADAYGISTGALRERNRIPADAEPRTRTRLVIRGKRRKRDVASVMPATERYSAVAARGRRSAVRTPTAVAATARPESRRRVEVITPAPVRQPSRSTATPLRAVAPTATAAPSAASAAPAIASVPTRHVTVNPGDTLYALSRRYGVSVAELRSLNGLSSNTIQVGQRLKVGK